MPNYGGAANFTAEFGGPLGGSGGSGGKVTTISLPLADWKGAASPYSQIVNVLGASVSSKIDLQGTAEQLAALAATRTVLYTSNNEGTITVYAIGDKPKTDLEFQASVSEVSKI